MKKVAIVTDTTACIPQAKVARYGIELVPVLLICENKSYRDGIDISASRFYNLLRQSQSPITTASSSPEYYLDSFGKASEQAESVLCLTEPSRFSAMFESATIAREMAQTSLPGVAIEVVDATTAAAGLGLVVLEAARTAAEGRDLNEVVATTRSVMSRVNLFATLDTLHYLAKSGRVPQAAALVNSLLKIKPVFTLNHSDAHTVALPRSSLSATKHMLKCMERNIADTQQPLHAAVMHADVPDKALALRNLIASRFHCAEIFITEFTPVMGVHTGPGLLGVAFYTNK